MKKQLWMSLILLILIAAIFIACATAAQPNQALAIQTLAAKPTEPLAEASNATTLLFLGNKNIAPVVFLDGTTPTGVAVDIVRALATHMPQPIEIKAMNWSEAQVLVARGDADALIQINPTEERKKVYDFSDPLLESHFSIFTRADRMGISGLSSLRGLRVGVESGGLPQRLLEKDPQVQLIIIPNFTEGFRQLNEGPLDAVVVDYRVGSYILAVNNIRNIKISGEPVESSYSSIAVKKGNTKLLNEINTALQIIKSDGTYEKIIEKWQPKETVFETREQITERNYVYTILILLVLFLIAGIWAVTIKKELIKRKVAEEKLNEQYSTLRCIIDGADALIYSVDRHYRYTSFNRGHAATMKTLYGAEIEPGHSILEYMTVEEDRKTARHNLDRALTGEPVVEEAYSGEELHSRQYFLMSHSPIRTEEEIIGVAVLAQDITDRKRAEMELARVNRALRMLSDS
ncbi:MAG: transporter substrate-binding domain-containing protein, partial [Methanoregula sp.]|nr:transporter substrate-binding domain-containing protein [Methanoregula sp.]